MRNPLFNLIALRKAVGIAVNFLYIVVKSGSFLFLLIV